MRKLIVFAALFSLVSAVRAELELTPRPSSYELEGIKFPQLVFSDGDKQVTYVPPAGWQYSGTSTKLTLRPSEAPQAEASITRSPLNPPIAFDEETLKKLTSEATAAISPESTGVEITSQQNSPVAIDGKPTFLVTMSYGLYGEKYGRSVMFMVRGNEMIRFQLVARLADFPKLQQAFLRSHFSWQNL